MAIKPETEFPGKILAGNANYPHGEARNITVKDDGLGTPWRARIINDIWGFFQKLLVDSSTLPSGSPDTVLASDYYTALSALFARQGSTNNFTLQQIFSSTQDVNLSGITGALIVGGDGTGPHIAIDSNEVVAKANATTGAILSLNDDGDVAMGAAAKLIQGIVPFARTAEFKTITFNSIPNGMEAEVVIGHTLGTDDIHFTMMTNQPSKTGYSTSITRPDGFAYTYSNGAVASPSNTAASAATATFRLNNNSGAALTIGFNVAIIGA